MIMRKLKTIFSVFTGLLTSIILQAQNVLVSSTPTTNSTNIVRNTNITLVFNANINQATVDNSTAGDPTDDNITISSDQTGLVAGTFSGGGTTTIIFEVLNCGTPGAPIMHVGNTHSGDTQ